MSLKNPLTIASTNLVRIHFTSLASKFKPRDLCTSTNQHKCAQEHYLSCTNMFRNTTFHDKYVQEHNLFFTNMLKNPTFPLKYVQEHYVFIKNMFRNTTFTFQIWSGTILFHSKFVSLDVLCIT